MTKEEYVTYEVAKLLKEKGFNESINTFYNSSEEFQHHPCRENINANLAEGNICSAPTQQMAMRWLRESKNVYIEIRRSANTFLYGAIIIVNTSATLLTRISNYYATYEQACEVAIQHCLEKLI